jgi:hypothetical protein
VSLRASSSVLVKVRVAPPDEIVSAGAGAMALGDALDADGAVSTGLTGPPWAQATSAITTRIETKKRLRPKAISCSAVNGTAR